MTKPLTSDDLDGISSRFDAGTWTPRDLAALFAEIGRLTEANANPIPPYVIVLVDIADKLRRMYGDQASYVAGREMNEHEWRFTVTSAAGLVTYSEFTTAGQIVASLDRDGVDVGRHGEVRQGSGAVTGNSGGAVGVDPDDPEVVNVKWTNP